MQQSVVTELDKAHQTLTSFISGESTDDDNDDVDDESGGGFGGGGKLSDCNCSSAVMSSSSQLIIYTQTHTMTSQHISTLSTQTEKRIKETTENEE